MTSPPIRAWISAVSICLLFFNGCQSIETFLHDSEVVGLEQPVWQKAYCTWTPDVPPAGRNEPRSNRSVAGTPLTVAGITYDTGIGLGGDGHVVYAPGGKAGYLEFLAGIDDRSPGADAAARVVVYGDNREIAETTIQKNRDPRPVQIPVAGVYQLQIMVTADDDTYTDLLLPRLTGIPGLRATLEAGRTRYEDTIYAPHTKLDRAGLLPDGAVLFPVSTKKFGACIGISNSHICVVIAPERDARIVHCGPTLATNILEGIIGQELHPLERRRQTGVSGAGTYWKWRVDPDGSVRLLSPIDIAHGVRWSRVLKLLPGRPVAHTILLLKNSAETDVSWSMGTELRAGTDSAIVIPRETAAPGYSLLSGNDNGIISDTGYVLVRQPYRRGTSAIGGQRVISSSAGSWMGAYRKGYLLLLKARQPLRGFYPYNGANVRIEMNSSGISAVLPGEITPLSPGEHTTQEQYWVLEPARTMLETAVTNALAAAAEAEEFVTRGEPSATAATGRSRGR